MTLISCMVVGYALFFACSLHRIGVWGYCIVYCCLGFVRAFFEIDENRPHTFLII